MFISRRNFEVRYDNIEIKDVKIIKHGGYTTSSIVSGISGNRQGSYDSNPNYIGRNGTYLNKSTSSYERVTYEVLISAVIRWKWYEETCEKYKTFDVTEYVDENIQNLTRLNKNIKEKIRKELLSKNYIVIHNVGEEWELYAENSNPSLLDFIGEAVYNN